MRKSEQLELKSIQGLFDSGQYIIPPYQRNYAWGQAEIEVLIRDIADYAEKHGNKDYYIGTLVVWKRKLDGEEIYETIDGQQRLTTLNILLSTLKREYALDMPWFRLNLAFDSRKKSTETLEALIREGSLNYFSHKKYNEEIQQAYQYCQNAIENIVTREKLPVFFQYLTKHVKIMRAEVPEDTDLNHYFEIMNNRGEQLEKHEILKSRFLNILKDRKREKRAFNAIWQACADMEHYVQTRFDPTQRKSLFGENLNTLVAGMDFSKVCDLLYPADHFHPPENSFSLAEILGGKQTQPSQENKGREESDRFTSIINFPNLLLHVLKIQTGKNIVLDDKQLIESFEECMGKSDEEKFAFTRQFGVHLLRCKWLFDQYILRRDFLGGQERWSLKKMKPSSNGSYEYVNTFGREDAVNPDKQMETLIMLQSMFHVSSPAFTSKHWMNAALKYVFENEQTKPEDFISYLEMLARKYLMNRYLQATQSSDVFHEIIYNHEALKEPSEEGLNRLHRGVFVENYIFNYLDYLLWKRIRNKQVLDFKEFSTQNSVEHYYPQEPTDNNPRIENEYLHYFGNLCLMNAGANARFSNNMPLAKKSNFEKIKKESIKQQLMMSYDQWGKDEILRHGNKMIKILRDEAPAEPLIDDLSVLK
ncbi:MAG: DUF262 domain-containing protein [Bacteroidota bacterium]|jgi:hypothetical protein